MLLDIEVFQDVGIDLVLDPGVPKRGPTDLARMARRHGTLILRPSSLKPTPLILAP